VAAKRIALSVSPLLLLKYGNDMNKEDWPKLDVNIKREQGFLYDKQIAAAMEKGKIITNGDAQGAKYACYELHIGNHIQQLILDNTPGSESDLYRVKKIENDGLFQIAPGETYKIYAAEELYMPADVFAIAIPVGTMFKLGLNPETTFADPGFSGPFYITVCNYSPRVVTLKVGDPLSRMFFCKLAERPDKIHEGRPREIPPAVGRVRRPSIEELTAEGEANVLARVLGAVDPPHYEHAYVTDRLFSHHRAHINKCITAVERSVAVSTLMAIFCALVVFIVAACGGVAICMAKWPAFSDGVLASLIAAVIWAGLTFGVTPIRQSLGQSCGVLLGRRGANDER